ncbi:MAG TPA: transporter [Desulfobulbaceae bacterium]|nr:transporter [Desulfobulbaceae bacterium]
MATPPVNPNLSNGGTLPKGVLYTALNPVFADKNHSQDGFTGPDTFSQAWLFKLRYGITNRLELNSVPSYVNLSRSDPTPAIKHLEGYGDQSLGLSYAFYNLHQGAPFALSFSAGVLLPTAPEGDNHLPGNAAWGGRASLDFGKFLTPDIKFDTGFVVSGPFERGNQDVKRGEQYQWNAQIRYLFNICDIALESSLVSNAAGDKRTPAGDIDLNNGSTEWFIGPSMNFVIDRYDLWFGIGIFFPVWQDIDSPAMVEDYQLAFKIGKLW